MNLSPIAKAVAALVTPIVLALTAAITERCGINVPLDPTITETAITAIVGSVIVYFVRNRE